MRQSDDQDASMAVNIDGNISLPIVISGFNPNLTSITWKHKGNLLTGTEDGVTITNSHSLPATTGPVQSTLQLSRVRPEDSGTYTVTACNDAGSCSEKFTLTVRGMWYMLVVNLVLTSD